MRYLASQIKLKPQKRSPEELIRDLTKAIGRKDIRNLRILRESIDARRKPDVKLVYTVEFECDKKLRFDKADAKARTYEAPVFPQKLCCETVARPVIAGFGPCGIFAALVLAEAGLRPIVIERGKSMDERIRDVEEFWDRLLIMMRGRIEAERERKAVEKSGGFWVIACAGKRGGDRTKGQVENERRT